MAGYRLTAAGHPCIHNRMRNSRCVRFSLLLLLLGYWIGFARENFAADKLRISYSAVNATQAFLWVAQEKGIFAKHGLEGELLYINSGTMTMLALLRRWGLGVETDLKLVDLGINDRSLEALIDKQIDAALLPSEKAFVAETRGFHIIADSLHLDFHWVPLATTRRFLRANRDLVTKVCAIYREGIRLFKTQPKETIAEITRRLPALADKKQVIEKCYKLFADLFEPSLTPSLPSVSAILKEVALQDPRANEIDPVSLIETVE